MTTNGAYEHVQLSVVNCCNKADSLQSRRKTCAAASTIVSQLEVK